MQFTMRPIQDIPAGEIKTINASPWMHSPLVFGAAVGDCPKSKVKIQALATTV